MHLKGNTILITGGSSGIGFALVERLIENNKVIICGRSLQKLEETRKLFPKIHITQCDLSIKEERTRLLHFMERFFPECNVVVHNAAIVHKGTFFGNDDVMGQIEQEIQTNILAPIELTHSLYEVLSTHQPLTMVYMSSGLAYVPKAAYPFYSATKAALHSFIKGTQVSAKRLPIRMIEVVLPVVDTPFHQGETPSSAISADKAADEIIAQLRSGKSIIQVGLIRVFSYIARFFPSFAFRKINSL